MLTRFLITVDTEGDNAWAGRGYEVNTENARYLPRFHMLCVRYGFKPTYFTTYAMAQNDVFVEFARDAQTRGECEIGAHLHAWNQPPEHRVTTDDIRSRPYLIEYPEPILKDKLRVLTDVLRERFQTDIRSHRPGRWALNEVYARALAEQGYLVDSSVTPHWRSVGDRPAPDSVRVPLPNYENFPADPYFLSRDNIGQSGDLPVLEMPTTIVRNYPSALQQAYDRMPVNIVKRGIRKAIGKPVHWLRPSRYDHRYMVRVARRRLAEGADYLMFMIHSSELMPGGAPNYPEARDIERLYRGLDRLFRWVRAQGLIAATCMDYYQHFTRK